ncbi:hypothetical protein M9458_053052 [Cirrhinus mrigala]|uniref:CCHC-type domain-containing protein n=1 Tax=Cirrhinus mrigala TaxID=683832 RepID=A0ABD0MRM3_CIRMR
MDGSTVTDLAMADGRQRASDVGLSKRQRDGNESEKDARKDNGKRIYLKEATVTVEIGQAKEVRAIDVIKAVAERIGDGRILAVRPKQTKEYEVTLEREEDAELLTDGLTIKGFNCDVKRLQNRDYVVSFMHLPVYVADKGILDKLEGWGVCPLSTIKRRVYPGTDIEDGTRFVKTRFPKEVASLPYSTRIETAEGPQYFRVMHSHQIKTCRLCMSPEHVVKDCPDFKCFKCEERGHFARDCNAIRCPDCRQFLNKCECWIGSEEEEEEEESQQISVQMHRRDNKQREEGTTDTQANEITMRKDAEQQQNIKDKQTVQPQQNEGAWTQMEITDSVQRLMDGMEQEQGNEDSTEEKRDSDLWTQSELTESLHNVLDTGEIGAQRNKELMEAKVNDEEWEKEKQGTSTKRRRAIKVKPNIETARKKVLKENVIESANKFEMLRDLEETG